MQSRKPWLTVLVLLALLATAGCGSTADSPAQPAQTPASTSAPQEETAAKTEEEIVHAMEEAKDFAYHWFYACTYVDETDVRFDSYQGMSNWTYRRVNYPGVTTFQDVRQLAEQYYTSDVVTTLMGNLAWTEVTTPEAALYVSDPNGLGGGMPVDAQVSIQQDTSTSYTITVHSYLDGQPLRDPYDVHYTYTDGKWLFDTSLLLFADSVTLL